MQIWNFLAKTHHLFYISTVTIFERIKIAGEQMETQRYEQILSDIRGLPLSEQLLLLEQTASLVRSRTASLSKPRSIMELKGKGKELWAKINIDKYIDEERASWSG